MKLTGCVDKLEDRGDSVTVTLANVRQKNAASWREYGPAIAFTANYRQARKSYPISTKVEITIKPK